MQTQCRPGRAEHFISQNLNLQNGWVRDTYSSANGQQTEPTFRDDSIYRSQTWHSSQPLAPGRRTPQYGPDERWMIRPQHPIAPSTASTASPENMEQIRRGVPPPKTKRAQVKNACTNCQQACKKCSNERPCERCKRYGLKDCVNSTRKPRARGVKRGPYKRCVVQPEVHSPPYRRESIVPEPSQPPLPLQSPPMHQSDASHWTAPVARPRLLQQMFQGSQPIDLEALPALTPLRATTPMPQHFDVEGFRFANQQHHQDLSPIVPSPSNFAIHAEQLRQSLEQAGFVSCPASPRFEPCTPMMPMIPFMGHAATAPNSPTGLRAFMELDD